MLTALGETSTAVPQAFWRAIHMTLNIHFHVLAPDGVFDDEGVFHHLPAPTDDVVHRLLLRTAQRLLREAGTELDDDDAQGDALLSLEQGSLAQRQAALPPTKAPRPLTAALGGFSLHAATRIAATDRKGLYRLCRYGARGAVAHSRVSELEDGRFAYEMKRAQPDGRRHLVMTGIELLRKLTPLIPPPWSNLTRYHGVFAPGSKLRALIVPSSAEDGSRCKAKRPPPRDVRGTILEVLPRRPRDPRPPLPRVPWAELLARVFGCDVLACEKCRGRMKVLAYIEKRSAVRAILQHLGLPAAPLPTAKSRGPPELSFQW
jgi:hypothetical protein